VVFADAMKSLDWSSVRFPIVYRMRPRRLVGVRVVLPVIVTLMTALSVGITLKLGLRDGESLGCTDGIVLGLSDGLRLSEGDWDG
jgi:hypothetical protein